MTKFRVHKSWTAADDDVIIEVEGDLCGAFGWDDSGHYGPLIIEALPDEVKPDDDGADD